MTQPTMRQVAERAGVSVALVSLVMRRAPNVSDYRRQLVVDAAAELGYRPNVLARNLASRRTNTIGVVLNDLHNPFFAEIIDGLQDAADATGHRVLIGNGRHSKAGESEMLETFLQFRVDALALVGSTAPLSTIEAAAGIAPVVAVGRSTRSVKFDTVNTDDRLGARLAVEHLLALGHSRIAHIDGGSGAGSRARRHGYTKAMNAAGMAEHITFARGDFSEVGGFEAARELLSGNQVPTAIFVANDLSAVGALDCAEEAGFRVPADVSIVGYDNTSLAAMHHLALTTINQPREELGRLALHLLLERLESRRTDAVHRVVAPSLIVRRTSGPTNSRAQAQ